jgi:hypothetical protein
MRALSSGRRADVTDPAALLRLHLGDEAAAESTGDDTQTSATQHQLTQATDTTYALEPVFAALRTR